MSVPDITPEPKCVRCHERPVRKEGAWCRSCYLAEMREHGLDAIKVPWVLYDKRVVTVHGYFLHLAKIVAQVGDPVAVAKILKAEGSAAYWWEPENVLQLMDGEYWKCPEFPEIVSGLWLQETEAPREALINLIFAAIKDRMKLEVNDVENGSKLHQLIKEAENILGLNRPSAPLAAVVVNAQRSDTKTPVEPESEPERRMIDVGPTEFGEPQPLAAPRLGVADEPIM